MTKYHALFGQWGTWMSWRLKCIIYMHRMFPKDTSTSPLPDLPSMFGWKVQTAREAQQASEEVRCSGWVHALHQNDPKCISSFLHCPRVRSCCWHGAISDNMIHMMQLWCYACERSDTHTHIHTVQRRCYFCISHWISHWIHTVQEDESDLLCLGLTRQSCNIL